MGDTCFIISPISTPPALIDRYGGDADHFRHVIEHLLLPAVEAAGFEPMSPIARGSDLIHAEIVRQLESAAMVLCDMSTLNANVFFELGIRTAVDKPFCLVHDPFVGTLPFDTGILNALEYEPSLSPWVLPGEVDRMAGHLRESSEGSGGRNTLWRYFGLTTRGSMEAADRSTVEEKLDFVIAELGKRDQALAFDPSHRIVALLRAGNAVTGRLQDPTDVEAVLLGLHPQTREVIEHRFGFFDGRLRTLEEVAGELGVSRQWVRQQESVGLNALREAFGPRID